MPEGQWISTESALLSEPSPKSTGPSLDEAYPTLVVMWLYWAPTVLLTILIFAPIPSRLLLVPCRAISTQWFEVALRFIQTSASLPSVVTTTSILPSPARSAKAQPRCRAFGDAKPASPVSDCH